MPELPEVEVVVRSLNQVLRGQQITSAQICRAKSFPQDEELLKKIFKQPITQIRRRAKFIIIDFANDYSLVTHLKMTGQLIYVSARGPQAGQTAGGGHPTADWTSQLPGNQTRIIYQLSDDGHLYFNDQRVFGWMKVYPTADLEWELFTKLGPDANTDQFQATRLFEQLRKKRIPIKQALMDNALVAGIGNIYAAEALFAASVDPRRPSQEVSLVELERIVQAVQKIMAASIASGGTTFDGKYVDALGKQGNFTEQLMVYGRAGQNCYQCGQVLEQIRQGGRSTVFCPHCQK